MPQFYLDFIQDVADDIQDYSDYKKSQNADREWNKLKIKADSVLTGVEQKNIVNMVDNFFNETKISKPQCRTLSNRKVLIIIVFSLLIVSILILVNQYIPLVSSVRNLIFKNAQ